jgi:hypothetical protein
MQKTRLAAAEAVVQLEQEQRAQLQQAAQVAAQLALLELQAEVVVEVAQAAQQRQPRQQLAERVVLEAQVAVAVAVAAVGQLPELAEPVVLAFFIYIIRR